MTTTGERQDWTPERIEEAKRLWNLGNTASEIADTLGGLTRSAVCGKLFRLGVMRKGPSVPTMRKAARPVKAPRKPKSLAPVIARPKLSAPALVVLTENACTLENLQPHSCRWVMTTEPALFCGEAKDGERAYCAGHSRMAFVQPRANAEQLHGNIKFFERLPRPDNSLVKSTLYGGARRA